MGIFKNTFSIIDDTIASKRTEMAVKRRDSDMIKAEMEREQQEIWEEQERVRIEKELIEAEEARENVIMWFIIVSVGVVGFFIVRKIIQFFS